MPIEARMNPDEVTVETCIPGKRHEWVGVALECSNPEHRGVVIQWCAWCGSLRTPISATEYVQHRPHIFEESKRAG